MIWLSKVDMEGLRLYLIEECPENDAGEVDVTLHKQVAAYYRVAQQSCSALSTWHAAV